MEFFKIITVKTTEEQLQKKLRLDNLDVLSSQLFVIGKQTNHEAEIGSLWGEFTLQHDIIRGGVRFALKECPNALCWTITTGHPPQKDAVILHLTINRTEKEQEFIEELEEFMVDIMEKMIGSFK